MSPPSVKGVRGRRPESNRKPEKAGRSRSSNPDSGRSPSNNRVAESRERENKKYLSSETDKSTKDDRIEALEDEVEQYKDKGKYVSSLIPTGSEAAKSKDQNKITIFKCHRKSYLRYQIRAEKNLLKCLTELNKPTYELAKEIQSHEEQYKKL
ncbi:hypothetical protein BOTCAL_0207g00010 [Botryotinia calthae]|uniref:Uncharacterized protein n=1 Tax=Botryotinia calthae TaxID=38488 RepID=A0A4Y8CZI4_9HELO|nr:hypothetical protein BOTCAL_0207g00010 [Botryotinia calthae]